jgi:hypothetical protein
MHEAAAEAPLPNVAIHRMHVPRRSAARPTMVS